MNSKQLRWFYLITVAIIWGSSFILMKKALIHLTPVQVGAIRIILTALFLFLVAFRSIFSITKKQWVHIATTAFVGTFFPAFLFAFAIEKIDSSIASILNSLTPLNTLIVGAIFYGFIFLKKQIIGIFVGLLGASLLILQGSEINPTQNYFYALFIVLSTIGYAFNVNILKKHLNDLNALTITTANFAILIIPAIIILFFTDFFSIEHIQNAKTSLGYLVLLSIFGTALAKTIYNRLVQISSPIFSSSVTYLIPLVAVFWGVLDGEKLHLSQLLTSSLILFGIYLTNKGK